MKPFETQVELLTTEVGLTELLNSPVSYEWTDQSPVLWRGRFRVWTDELKNVTRMYMFNADMNFSNLHFSNPEQSTFSRMLFGSANHEKFRSLLNEVWEIVFAPTYVPRGKNQFGIHDLKYKQSVLEVGSTVLAMVRDLIRKEKPRAFYFTAKGRSRKELYMRVMKKLLPQFTVLSYQDSVLIVDPKLVQELGMQTESLVERAEFEDSYRVRVSPDKSNPTLTISGVGSIRLFYVSTYYSVHMIRGKTPGAGSVLYFAALFWALQFGIKGTFGKLASDTTLSPDAARARRRFQKLYRSFLYVLPHPDAEDAHVRSGTLQPHRLATSGEASMWRLKKMPPVKFEFA